MALSRIFAYSFIDLNGLPLDGGNIYCYLNRGTTKSATYCDVEGTINPWPVTLDSYGRADIFVDSETVYRFEVKDSDGRLKYVIKNVTTYNSTPTPEHSVDYVDGTTDEIEVIYMGGERKYLVSISDVFKRRISNLEERIDEQESKVEKLETNAENLSSELSNEIDRATDSEKRLSEKIDSKEFVAIFDASKYFDILRYYDSENNYIISCCLESEKLKRLIKLPLTAVYQERFVFCGYYEGCLISAEISSSKGWTIDERDVRKEIKLSESEYDELEEQHKIDPTVRYMVVED